MAVARSQMGVRERLPTGGGNPRIVEYFSATAFKSGDADDAWCSAFANWCMSKAGIPGTGAANARSWLHWGILLEQFVPGCVVVYERPPNPGSGHVHFGVQLTGSTVIGLGGNQSNMVRLQAYPRSRVLGYRYPTGWKIP